MPLTGQKVLSELLIYIRNFSLPAFKNYICLLINIIKLIGWSLFYRHLFMKNGTINIVVFDGVCILCNKTVQWIIRNDSKSKFRFTSAQSEVGQLLLKEHGLSSDSFKSILYILDNRIYIKSTAVLQILRRLDGGFQLLYCLIIIPRVLRDMVYDFIANRRYRWFGKLDSCIVPGPECRGRFLE